MINFDCTIAIPMMSQPNFLAIALQGLVKHSILKHRTLVIYSRPEVQGYAPARDYIMDTTLRGYHKYTSIQDYHEKHKDWCMEHHIEFHDVTDKALAFEEQYKAGNIYPGGIWAGGQDTAFKDNLGLVMTDTELIVNNFDADFYPGPGWDAPLAAILREHSEARVVAMPVHVQPYIDRTHHIPEPRTNIFEDTRHIACNRPILSLPNERDNNQVYEQEWIGFVQTWKREETIYERCGVRDHLHWVPTMVRTKDAKEIIGEWGYKGPGYDLEMDDRCGRLGFMKVCPRTSFILHKGFIVDEGDA